MMLRILHLFVFAALVGLFGPALDPCLSASSHELGIPSYAGFREIDSGRTHFIVVGDTQSTSGWEFWRERNDRQRRLLIEEIARRAPAFVVHLGDLTTRGSSEMHWRDFDELHRGIREKGIPYFPVLGNHDLYGSDRKALGLFFSRFPHLEGRRWYEFSWRGIGFILLDANLANLSPEEKLQQEQWYLSELERFDKQEGIDTVLAFCHQSPFTNSRVVDPSEKSRVYFADPFGRSLKAGLFFSGHSHAYERFEIEGTPFVVSGGGGGPRHRLYTEAGQRRYRDLYPGPDLRFFHFCEIETEEKALQFKVVRLEDDETFRAVDPLTVPRPLLR
jgi:3',5'-cyclic AMP phosphodiesterase CpdA